MLKQKNSIKSVLQIDESQFRKAGKYGDKLISILKGREEDMTNNTLLIQTRFNYQHHSLEIQAFNFMLQSLRRDNVVAIQIVLD
tara:strand:+ start:1020 stop:1271 length:252 start_codon:yes stop_codon:yes gene_type:complete